MAPTNTPVTPRSLSREPVRPCLRDEVEQGRHGTPFVGAERTAPLEHEADLDPARGHSAMFIPPPPETESLR